MRLFQSSALQATVAVLAVSGVLAACQTSGGDGTAVRPGLSGIAAEYAAAGIYETGLVAAMPAGADCPAIGLGFGTGLNRSGKKRPAAHGQFHAGVDWALPEGTPIMAIGDGQVIAKGDDPGDTRGKYIAIEHSSLPGDITSNYTHLSGFSVDEGAHVKRGQVIGYVGGTGRSTTFVHLHLNVYGRERVAVRGRIWRYRYDYLQFLSRDMTPIDPVAKRSRTVPVAYLDRSGTVHPPGAEVIWPFVCSRKAG